MQLKFADDVFPVQGGIIRAPWTLRDLRQIGDRIIALGDYMKVGPPELGLACYATDGTLLWEATGRSGACTAIIQEEPTLKVSCWDGYLCTIDIETGRTLESVFTK